MFQMGLSNLVNLEQGLCLPDNAACLSLSMLMPSMTSATVLSIGSILVAIGLIVFLGLRWIRRRASRGSLSNGAWASRVQLLSAINGPLVQGFPNGILLADLEGRVLAVNQSCCALHLMQARDLIGQTVNLLLSPRDYDQVWQLHQQVLEGGRQECVLEGRRSDGSRFPMRMQLFRLDEWHLCYVNQDISNDQALRQHASESETKYRMLLDNSPQGIGIHVDGKMVFVNSAMVRMFGYATADEMIGLPAVETIVESQRSTARERNQILLSSICAVPPRIYDFIRADGSTFKGEVYSGSLEIDGRLSIQTQILDVTARVESQRNLELSERRYRELAEQSTEAIWRIDFDPPVPIGLPIEQQVDLIFSDAVLSDCNDLMANYYGMDSAAQVKGRRLLDIHEACGMNQNRDRAARFIKAGYIFQEEKIPIELPNGERRIYIDDAVGIVINSCLVTVKGTSRNVTEQMRIQEQLQASDQRFRQFLQNSTELIWCLSFNPPVSCSLPLEEQVDQMIRHAVLEEGNDLSAEFFGKRKIADLLGRKLTDIYPDASLVEARELFRLFIIGGYKTQGIEEHTIDRIGREQILLSNTTGIIQDDRLLMIWGTSRNITERMELQSRIRENEAHYSLALEGGQLGTWDWNLESGAVSWNDRMHTMLGFEPGAISTDADSYARLVHPQDREEYSKRLNAHLAGMTEFYENEHRLRDAHGAWIWILDKGKVIERDQDGRPLRVSGTHLDITSRKLIEEKLIASEQRYRELTSKSTEAIWRIEYDPPVPIELPLEEQITLIRENGVLSDCNDLMAEIYGRKSAGEVVGRRISKLLSENGLAMNRERAARFISANYNFHDERMTLVYPDGSNKTYLDNAQGTVIDGKLVTVWGTSRDITEQSQIQQLLIASEQRFRQLVDKSSEAIWCLEYYPPVDLSQDPQEILRQIQNNGVLAECNDLMAELYGVESAEQILGLRTPEIAALSTLVPTGNRIQRLIDNNYHLKDEIMQLEYQDGTRRVYLYNADGYIRQGQLTMIWGTSRNITDRMEMQEQLREGDQRYALDLQAGGLGTWDLNVASGRVEFNDRFAEILGYEANKLTWNFDTWIRTVHSADRQRVLSSIRSIINGESDSFELEQRLRHASGDWIWTLTKGQVIHRKEDGEADRVLGTETDITQRKRAEDQLRSSERRYREFVVNSTENLWCLAFEKPVPTDLSQEEQIRQMMSDAYISDCNDRYARSWGYKQAEDLIGRRFLDINADDMAKKSRRMFSDFITGNYRLSDSVEAHNVPGLKERYFMSNASGVVINGSLQMIWGTSRELTDLIVARSRLEESEQRYRDFVANSSEAIWRFDYDPPIPVDLPADQHARLMFDNAVLAECNDVYARVFGFASAREVLGCRMCELLKPYDGLIDMFQRFVEGGYRIVDGEDESTPASLRDRYFLNSAQGIIQDGCQIMTWGTTRDITEQRLASIALAESERQMSSMMEISPVGIFHLQLDGQVRYMNPRSEQMFGLTISECKDSGWLNSVHIADRDRIISESMRMVEHHESLETELRLMRNNEILWVIAQISPVKDNTGSTTGFVGILTDITDRKLAETSLAESEKRNRELIHTMAEGLMQVNAMNLITFVNPNACTIMGRSAEELQGREMLEYVAETDKQQLLRQQADRRQGITSSYELDILRPDGSHRRISITGCPQFDENGNYAGALGTFQDITETQQLARQLQQAQKMEAVGVLAGGIAHDFNNILQAMLGFADLAQDQLDPLSDAAGCLVEISAAGNRAADLVRQMLTFSRQSEQEKVLVSLSAIVHESVGLLRGSLPSTISIVTEIMQTDLILGNPTQLHQVIMNLSTNAFHAMRDSGGQLLIGCRNMPDGLPTSVNPGLEPGMRMVELRVADNGHGMDHETASRVFDPYFTTKRVGEGTGLGLATVHGIVKSMGGFINIDSEPGSGTVISILLPCEEVSHIREAELEESPAAIKGTETIMLVDDEPGILAMLRGGLERQGYRTVCFPDGQQAWAYWQEHPDTIDVVVTDQTMPHMRGDELCRRLLGQSPGLPVLLCTGYSDLINEESAVEMGISSYVSKPIVPRELARQIRSVLSTAAARTEGTSATGGAGPEPARRGRPGSEN
jgi:PAS domain S-box-containing protein